MSSPLPAGYGRCEDCGGWRSLINGSCSVCGSSSVFIPNAIQWERLTQAVEDLQALQRHLEQRILSLRTGLDNIARLAAEGPDIYHGILEKRPHDVLEDILQVALLTLHADDLLLQPPAEAGEEDNGPSQP